MHSFRCYQTMHKSNHRLSRYQHRIIFKPHDYIPIVLDTWGQDNWWNRHYFTTVHEIDRSANYEFPVFCSGVWSSSTYCIIGPQPLTYWMDLTRWLQVGFTVILSPDLFALHLCLPPRALNNCLRCCYTSLYRTIAPSVRKLQLMSGPACFPLVRIDLK